PTRPAPPGNRFGPVAPGRDLGPRGRPAPAGSLKQHFGDRRWLFILGKLRVWEREARLLPALLPSPSTGDDGDRASATGIHKVRPDDVCDALHDQDDVD